MMSSFVQNCGDRIRRTKIEERRKMASRKRDRNGELKEAAYPNNIPYEEWYKKYSHSAPLHYMEAAKQEREDTDYSIKIPLEAARSGRANRRVRVYADGIYDMFHSGHAKQLMQIKMAIPNSYLIVGVCNDDLTHHMKGRTVMNEFERYEAVRHCRYADEIVTDAPWLLEDDFLNFHKIDFVAHDDIPYAAGDDEDVYKTIKERGMFLATDRTEGISTTDVIARIIKDYDMYIRRNLARGYTAKELNVSYMREKKIQFEEKYDKLVDKGKEIIGKVKTTKDKGNEMLHKWEEKSKDFISNFLDLFGKEGRIKTWFQESKAKIGRAISPTPSLEEPSSPASSYSSGTYSPPAKRGRISPSELHETGTRDEEEW
ncbi:hypothetical protein ScPMuIL_017703 [Solemya velum]